MISYISLFLELLLDQIIPKTSYFLPLFTVVSLLFLKVDKYYYVKLFILGFIYDLLFTELIFIHSIIFIILGLIIRILKRNNIIVLILIITIYQILLYLSYTLFNKININLGEFIYIIKNYYILNIICYIILRIIYRKKS